jgi:hypothetical protein
MRKMLMAAALLLALGYPTFAGEIHNPKPQPAPTATVEQEPTTDDTGEPDSFTETVLSVLESLLALL